MLGSCEKLILLKSNRDHLRVPGSEVVDVEWDKCGVCGGGGALCGDTGGAAVRASMLAAASCPDLASAAAKATMEAASARDAVSLQSHSSSSSSRRACAFPRIAPLDSGNVP